MYNTGYGEKRSYDRRIAGSTRITRNQKLQQQQRARANTRAKAGWEVETGTDVDADAEQERRSSRAWIHWPGDGYWYRANEGSCHFARCDRNRGIPTFAVIGQDCRQFCDSKTSGPDGSSIPELLQLQVVDKIVDIPFVQLRTCGADDAANYWYLPYAMRGQDGACTCRAACADPTCAGNWDDSQNPAVDDRREDRWGFCDSDDQGVQTS